MSLGVCLKEATSHLAITDSFDCTSRCETYARNLQTRLQCTGGCDTIPAGVLRFDLAAPDTYLLELSALIVRIANGPIKPSKATQEASHH